MGFDMEKVFNLSHGAFDQSKMINLSDIISDEDALDSYLGMTCGEVEESLSYLGVDANDIFISPENFIHPIQYMKGFTVIDIPILKLEFLKTFRTKESIDMWNERFCEWNKKGDWDSIISLVDKRIALMTFVKNYKEIPKEQVVDIFIQMYARQEFGFSLLDEELIEDVYSHAQESKEWNARMIELPVGEEIIVYRGSGRAIKEGYSWTTSLDTAKFFANRYGANGVIYKGTVKRDDVLDYYCDRGEQEVLVNPMNVKGIEVII